MRFMFDSNVLIAASLGQNDRLHDHMAQCGADDIVTSAIVYAEVVFGAMQGKPPLLDRLRVMIEEIPVLPFDQAAGIAYAALPSKRGSYDQLIAAHAVSLGLTLVTDNERHFAGVANLSVENWMRAA